MVGSSPLTYNNNMISSKYIMLLPDIHISPLITPCNISFCCPSNYPLLYAPLMYPSNASCIRHVSTNEKRDDGWTCLHIAASQGYAAMVSYLLQHKSEIDIRTSQGETSLHLASHNNNIAIIELLVTLGKANLELTDRDERTPLYVAARQGHLLAVQYLVERGSLLDTTNDIGWTPLVMACRNNHLGNCESGHFPFCCFLAGNSTTSSPYHVLLFHSHPSYVFSPHSHTPSYPLFPTIPPPSFSAVATYLIGKGADMEKRDNWGRTALFISASEGRAQMVSLLGQYAVDQ